MPPKHRRHGVGRRGRPASRRPLGQPVCDAVGWYAPDAGALGKERHQDAVVGCGVGPRVAAGPRVESAKGAIPAHFLGTDAPARQRVVPSRARRRRAVRALGEGGSRCGQREQEADASERARACAHTAPYIAGRTRPLVRGGAPHRSGDALTRARYRDASVPAQRQPSPDGKSSVRSPQAPWSLVAGPTRRLKTGCGVPSRRKSGYIRGYMVFRAHCVRST